MNHTTFADRSEAGWMLVERLRGERFHDPLVLAIPRGGIEVGAALARGLGAQLDVVLSRKLRAPHQPELALGAVSEDGSVHLNHFAAAMTDAGDAWIEAERRRQLAEIDRRREMFRSVRPHAPITGRTVILTDDGIATGATMRAGLQALRARGAAQMIVAAPVGAADSVESLREDADEVVVLETPAFFHAVGQWYENFGQTSDEEVRACLGVEEEEA